MLRGRPLGLLGTLSLVGISIAGYAYATSCVDPPSEVLDMQLISVTYDGTPQVDPPEYAGVSGQLSPTGGARFFMELRRQTKPYPSQLEVVISMRNRSFLRGLLSLPLFMLGSCYGGSCPTYDTVVRIESGAYRGNPGLVSKRAVIDRQAGTATFTFQRNGKQVVETWKLTTGTWLPG